MFVLLVDPIGLRKKFSRAASVTQALSIYDTFKYATSAASRPQVALVGLNISRFACRPPSLLITYHQRQENVVRSKGLVRYSIRPFTHTDSLCRLIDAGGVTNILIDTNYLRYVDPHNERNWCLIGWGNHHCASDPVCTQFCKI